MKHHKKFKKVQQYYQIIHLKIKKALFGTSISGIVGCGITVAFLVAIGYVIKLKRKKEITINE